MSVPRTLLVGLSLLAVLTLPGPADAAVPAGAAPRAMAITDASDTAIRFLNFHSVRAYGDSVTISGQVAATVNGTTGAVAGVDVRLFRRAAGSTTWQYLATATTSSTDTPKFAFTTVTRATAAYQVRFAGNSAYQPATGQTKVAVHRKITGTLEDRSGHFHGHVAPGYSHRWVHLEKRKCADCGWRRVRTARTGDSGGYRFTVGAPRSGRWYWRVTTSATKTFVRSSSGVFATRLV